MDYIKSNLNLAKHPEGTVLSTPLKVIKGLSAVLRAVYNIALDNPSHQYLDESLVTIQANVSEIYAKTSKLFRNKYTIDDTRNAIRILSLGNIVVPCTMPMLNMETRKEKAAYIISTHNESGYIGLPSVYLLPDISYTGNLRCDRLSRDFSIKVHLTYLSVAATYGYTVANRVYGNLNNWIVPTPSVNQLHKLADRVKVDGVITIDDAKKYLVPAKRSKEDNPPVSNRYYLGQLKALDMLKWFDTQGIVYSTIGNVKKSKHAGIKSRTKVLFIKEFSK